MRRLLLTTALTLLALPAVAEDAALLLGVERYQNLDRYIGGTTITNAADELAAAGYTVEAASNQSEGEMRILLRRLETRTADADRLVVAMSGRFATDGSRSWLLAAPAIRPSLLGIGEEAISVETVLRLLATVPGKSILLLAYDQSDSKSYDTFMRAGLGTLEIPQGVTVIVGDPRNVTGLIEDTIVTPNAEIVKEVASSRNISLSGYRPNALIMQTAANTPEPRSNAPYIVDRVAETLAWQQATGADSLEGYRAYLQAHPRGSFAQNANDAIAAILAEPNRAARLQEESLALTRDERRGIQRDLSILNYNTRGIDGIFGQGTRSAISNWQQQNGFAQTGYVTDEQVTRIDAQAARRSAQIEEDAARERDAQIRRDRAYWEETGANGREPGLRSYLDRFPDGIYAEAATSALAQIEQAKLGQAQQEDRVAWTLARRSDTVESYQTYLKAQPRGAFRDEATARLNERRNQQLGATNRDRAQAGEAALNLNQVTRRMIETRLAGFGFDPGDADGQFDAKTRRAIRQFQRSRNLEPTGFIDQSAVVQLLVRLSR